MIEEAPGSLTFGQCRVARADTFDTRRLKAPTIHLHFNKPGSWMASKAPLQFSPRAHQANPKLIRPVELQIYNMSHIIIIILGAVHILRQPQEGGGGVSQKLTIADEGGVGLNFNRGILCEKQI